MDVVSDLDDLGMHDVIGAAPLGILICDSEGRICFLNEKMTNIFGYDEGELLGLKVELLKEMGCEYGQGFTLAPLMSYSELVAWLELHA